MNLANGLIEVISCANNIDLQRTDSLSSADGGANSITLSNLSFEV
jgi:hypothetical protein